MNIKRLIPLLFLVVIPLSYYNRSVIKTHAENVIYYSPCENPIKYRIGSIDQRFNLTKDQFHQSIHKAQYIWSNAESKALFEFSPDGELEINLVYDQRQFLNTQVNELDTQLKEQQKSLDPEIAEYKRKTTAYSQRVDQLNKDIEYWNSRGGAPPEEYDKLKLQQESLRNESIQLQQEANRLNQSTDEFNNQVGELTQTVDNFNQALKYKPEEGEYVFDGKNKIINVYFNNSETELVHTLAHELGHALEIDHNNNELSIMYPRTTQAVTLSPDDLRGLKNACAKQSIIQNASDNFSAFMYQLGKNLQNLQSSFAK